MNTSNAVNPIATPGRQHKIFQVEPSNSQKEREPPSPHVSWTGGSRGVLEACVYGWTVLFFAELSFLEKWFLIPYFWVFNASMGFIFCLQCLQTVALILIFSPQDGQFRSTASLAIEVSQQPGHSYSLSLSDSGNSVTVSHSGQIKMKKDSTCVWGVVVLFKSVLQCLQKIACSFIIPLQNGQFFSSAARAEFVTASVFSVSTWAEDLLITNILWHKGHSRSIPIHSSWTCKSLLQCGHFVINSAITAFLFLLFLNKKRGTFRRSAHSSAYHSVINPHLTEMCHAICMDTPILKMDLFTSFLKW